MSLYQNWVEMAELWTLTQILMQKNNLAAKFISFGS